MMSASRYQPWLHRLALSTACVAMVTVVFGALTTSKNAGMAFENWPNSDEYTMVTYPWLRDFGRNWNKFLEHGHRLAGMLIGMWSIALVMVTFRLESRRWVRGLSIAILLGVICQGILGGYRVLLDERGLAMLHGAFAALVFSLMATMAVVTSQGWLNAAESKGAGVGLLKALAMATVGLLAVQYLLGGFIRHRGTGLHEHLGMGIVAYMMVWVNAIVVQRCSHVWLRRSAWTLVALTTAQVLLGVGAWFFKYGFAPLGIVAVAESVQQLLMRTVHTVFGILVFMTAVVHAVRVVRVGHFLHSDEVPFSLTDRTPDALTAGGAS